MAALAPEQVSEPPPKWLLVLTPPLNAHPAGQRICRRGTERPCYRLAHVPDPRQRVSFEGAREACRGDGGELLSIETEDEQRLVERFLQDLAGDFWVGLRRSLRHREPGVSCSALYYWLDRSQATFR